MPTATRTLAVLGAASLTAAVLAASAGAQPLAPKVQNALSAAPRAVAKDAAVVAYPGGKVLRAGSNGWTCMPDDPATPGDDPWCADPQTMRWAKAWMAHKKPHLAAPGLGYMLRGGSDPSNTDPYATEPPAGEHWHHDGPHVMVFPTQRLKPGTYSTDHDSGGPYVMWAGTPYEHYMMPTAR